MDNKPPPFSCDAEEAEAAEITFTPRELEMIAEAEASIEAVGTIPAEEVWTWLESLGTDSPLPKAQSRKR